MAIFPEMLPHIIQLLTASHVIVWAGIKESDTGLAVPSQWDLVSDKQMMQEEQPLQVSKARNLSMLCWDSIWPDLFYFTTNAASAYATLEW